MKYNLCVEGRTVEVEFSASAGSARAEIDGKVYEIGYSSGGLNCVRIALAGEELELFVAPVSGWEKQVSVRGRSFLVQDADRQPRQPAHGGSSSPGDVTPPMPSVVAKVLVAEGDEVLRGQSLVVVSAMKMETTLRAPSDGVVRRVSARVGLKTGPGDILVEIEEREQNG